MNKRVVGILMAAFIAVLAFQSCEKEENDTKISSNNSDESHKSGQNCMSCHVSGGSGEGWFLAAGTIYESNKTTAYPNATVMLYTATGGTGTLKATIEVDDKGNFYTTETIDFGSGLFPAVEGSTGTKYMISSVTTGQCNSCHGSTTDPIWTE
jgi:mono/diheme cytochrome c family protein